MHHHSVFADVLCNFWLTAVNKDDILNLWLKTINIVVQFSAAIDAELFRLFSHYMACQSQTTAVMVVKGICDWFACEAAVSKSATSNSSSDPWRVDLSDSDSDVAPKGYYFVLIID